jgi:hypothetical protein
MNAIESEADHLDTVTDGAWDELELFNLTPIVNTLLCGAMVVEKDRDHMKI